MGNKHGKPAAVLVMMQMLLLGPALPARVALAAPPDGDVNQDGAINIADVYQGMRAALGQQILLPDEKLHADVAPVVAGIPVPDDVVDTADVVILLRMVLGRLYYGYPLNQFNIGDSIGEAQAADSSAIGDDTKYHEYVWSTGYSDSFNSYNKRFEAAATSLYTENNATLDAVFNHAVSGAVMADFVSQAQGVVAEAEALPGGKAGMVTVLLGNNDVCAPSLDSMTDRQLFEDQFKDGLDVLAGSAATRNAQIQITGIPAIYWLWVAKRNNFLCWFFIWPNVPCQNLLGEATIDCVSSTSRNDPDNDYPNETQACTDRKQFHRAIRDEYNSRLRDVTDQYREDGLLPNARYVDIYDVQFSSSDITDADCFHPSVDGQAKLAQKTWCRTHWGIYDDQCPN
ncbi:MAG: SGNH/GDSL hydrolase family protein [Gammaproteobacteria bacterium]|jgi:lysophospholipase L1-like esterase